MATWQQHQQHDEQIRAVLRGDEMDATGRIRQWHGAATLAKLATAGHSSLGFAQCQCNR